MAGKSQDYWFKLIHSFVQASVYDREEQNTDAIFQALAVVFYTLDCALEDHIERTFICTAVDEYLNEHGSERNIYRTSGETNAQLQQRIKNLVNTTSCVELKRIVDSLLDVGESTFTEDYEAGIFFDREHFFDRGEILIDPIYNVFSIVVDNQVHDPYSFYDREYFLDREDFIGRQESSFELFDLIVNAVNRAKACGTMYRLIERA